MLLTVPISVTGTDDVALFAGVRKFRDGQEIGFLGSYGFTFDLVTHGMLVASHRRVDVERSLPYQPFHPFTEPEPLTAGQPVELRIELLPSATLFKAGDELRLDLRGRWFFSRNPLIGQFPPAYAPTARQGTCTVHTGGPHHAFLIVPVAGDHCVPAWPESRRYRFVITGMVKAVHRSPSSWSHCPRYQ